MGINADLMNLISNCFRVFWINLVGIVVSILLCNALMEKRSKKHLKILSIYVVLKMLYAAILVNVVFRHYFEAEEWWFLFHSISSILTLVINFWMFYQTFYGTLVKILGGIVLAEMIAMPITFAGNLLVNLISNRAEFLVYADEFYISDLMLGLVIGILFAIFYPLFAPSLKKYRKYQIRYPKFTGSLICIYTFGCQIFSMTDFTDPKQLVITVYVWACVLLLSVMVIAIMEFRKYQKQTIMETDFLQKQQKMMEMHYQALQSQERWMEVQKKQIAVQMQKIEQVEQKITPERIKEYFEKLKETYTDIQAGMYCDDWKLDALLYCQGEVLKNQGCEFSCMLQEYERGNISEEDIIHLLHILLNHGIMENRKEVNDKEKYVHLKLAAVKNQLLISFACTRGNYRVLKKEIKAVCRRYEGNVSEEKIQSGLNILIILRRK